MTTKEPRQRLAIRIEPHWRQRLDQEAAIERRSRSDMARILLTEALEARAEKPVVQ